MIDRGDTIRDVERFELKGEKYLAVLYRGTFGAILRLIDNRIAEKVANACGIKKEIKMFAKGDIITNARKFEYATYLVAEFLCNGNAYAAVFGLPESMLDIARQYLVHFGTEITSNPKEIVTHSATRILIKRNRGEAWKAFEFGGEKYIAELYKIPKRCGEIHFSRNDKKVQNMIALATDVFKSLGEPVPDCLYDSYEFVRKLIETLRKHNM